MSNKTNKLAGRKSIGGDSRQRKLKGRTKRAANKASRKAGKVSR